MDFILDKNSVANNFDQAAQTYNQAAGIQCVVGDHLLERLALIPIKPKVVLDLGSGSGLYTKALAKEFPRAKLLALDLSEKMLSYSRKQTRVCLKTLSHCRADIEKLPLKDASVDLVFSNLVLHWASNVDAVLQEIKRVLRPDGCLLFSTLGVDSLKQIRKSWRQVDDGQHVHAFLDLKQLGDGLLRHGFKNPVVDKEDLVLVYPNPKAMLKELKATGCNNIHPQRKSGLTGKTKFSKFLQGLETQKTDEDRYPLTFDVIYGHAWGAPQQAAGRNDEVIIPLSSIRRSRD